MKCYICDGNIEDPAIDHRDMKFKPCRKCESVIQDCVDSFRDPNEDVFAYIESDEPENVKELL